MVMAVATAMCATTLTACGGDDDDLLEPEETGTITFYEPCLEWGCNTDYVQAYMSGWELTFDGGDGGILGYANKNATMTVYYSFFDDNNGLSMSSVIYVSDNVNYFISEIKKRYNITLTKDEEYSKGGYVCYYGTGTIGGQASGVVLQGDGTSVTVNYILRD